MFSSQSSAPISPPHEVITFYSYKGGTGRTMALANLACLLAREFPSSDRVLVIDWDLEAPGLHYYFKASSTNEPFEPRPGVVEYFSRLAALASNESAKQQPDEDVAAKALLAKINFSEFIQPTLVPNIDLMRAGSMDDTYHARVGKLDWEGLYKKVPALFRTFAEQVAEKYAAVLVDSRTGMTDISGICTALLPNKLVVVFTPNRQSLTGIENLVRKSIAYRRESKDIRPLLVYPLPSRIDSEQDKLRELWRHGDKTRSFEGYQAQFERILRESYALETCDLTGYCSVVQVQYSPEYSFGEEIAVLDAIDPDRFSIVQSYEALMHWLCTSAAPWESPENARKRNRLVALAAEESKLRSSSAPEDRRQLQRLQYELVSLSQQTRGEQHQETLAAVERLIETLLADPESLPDLKKLLGAVSQMLPQMREPPKLRAVGTLLKAAGVLRTRGYLDEAQHLVSTSLRGLDETKGDIRGIETDALETTAKGLSTEGKYPEAAALQLWILGLRRKLYGDEHQETLTSMNNLAATLHDQGDLAGARTLQEELLKLSRRVQGEEHPDTLTSMNNLAVIHRDRGDLPGARTLQEKVLNLRRRGLGEEHADTLTSMNNLAATLRDQGDFDAARTLQEKVLEAARRVLGEEHADTLNSMSNLALTLHAQGDLAGARTLQEKVLEVTRRVLGEEHPNTLSSMNDLAATLRAQGDLAGARALQEKVLNLRRRVQGEEHPHTLISMNNLAATLRDQGDLAGARALQEKVLDLRRRGLGEEHPHTLNSINNLALTLHAQGDFAGARALQEKVLDLRRRVLGEEHPDTLSSMNNLAAALRTQGDLAGARTLQEKVLEVSRRVLGEEHPDTLISMNNLASTLRDQGDLAGARALQEKVLERSRRLLGEEHPHTLIAVRHLAATLRDQGDFAGARALQEKVLEVSRRVLGEEHPNTLSAMSELASTFLAMGNVEAARRLQETLLASQRRLLGQFPESSHSRTSIE